MTDSNLPQALSAGQTIQWYRVDEVLGRGGFGMTYLATDNNLDHQVAIKEYFPAGLVERQADKTLVPVSPAAAVQFREGLQRFLSEARTLVKFRHPNIVRVMAVFEANSTAYLVMEYEEGERFKEAVRRQGGADELTLKGLLLNIIDGLEQVHQHGFIHRDIKPVNIIIRHDGSPVLLDFGASRVVDGDTGQPHTSFVSAGFTPLEQYQEGAGMATGPWTDIYSLGATLYYAISGKTPVTAVSRLASIVKKAPDPLLAATEVGHGHYSSEFLEAIDWALAFKTSDRPQTLMQWRDAIVRSKPAGRKSAKLRPKNRRRHTGRTNPESAPDSKSRALLVVGAVVLLAIGAGWFFYDRSSSQRQLSQLLQRADALSANNELLAARSLYGQAMEVDPENQQASELIDDIDRRVEESVISMSENGLDEGAQSLLDEYQQVRPQHASDLRARLEVLLREREWQSQLSRVETDIAGGNYENALVKLDNLRQSGASDEKINVLEEQAQSQLNAKVARQREVENRRLQQEEARLENERLLQQANARQRQRRRDYRQFLLSAKWALQNDNLDTARKWLDSASAMQISDDELTELKAQLDTAEKFLQEPLSSYEISYARGQFNALKRAIELKNAAAIEELVGKDTSRINLFKTLFQRYIQITVSIKDIQPGLDPKRVTATLHIEKMALQNGDVVYPSATYRDTELSIERERFSWSPIRW